jgi:hypothetical protein
MKAMAMTAPGRVQDGRRRGAGDLDPENRTSVGALILMFL